MSSTRTAPTVTTPLVSTARFTAALTLLADVVLVIGRLAGWHGFQADDNGSTAGAIAFLVFAVGFVVTLVLTIVLAVKRRRDAVSLSVALVIAVALAALEMAGVFG